MPYAGHMELEVLRAKGKSTLSSFLDAVIMKGCAKMKTPAWVPE